MFYTHALVFSPRGTGYGIIVERQHRKWEVVRSGVFHREPVPYQMALDWVVTEADKHDPPLVMFGAWEKLPNPITILIAKRHVPVFQVSEAEARQAAIQAQEHLDGFLDKVHNDEKSDLTLAFNNYLSVQALAVGFSAAYYPEINDEEEETP